MGTWGPMARPLRTGFIHMRHAGAVVSLPIYLPPLQDEHSFLYRRNWCTCNMRSFKLLSWRVVVSYPELLLWFSKPALPHPGHSDLTVILISISLTFFLLSMCIWAHYFQGRKRKSGHDAVDKSEYYTPSPQWASASSAEDYLLLTFTKVLHSPQVN